MTQGINNFFKDYFTLSYDGPHKSAKKISHVTLIVPLIFAISYAISTLFERVKTYLTAALTITAKKINAVAWKQFHKTPAPKASLPDLAATAETAVAKKSISPYKVLLEKEHQTTLHELMTSPSVQNIPTQSELALVARQEVSKSPILKTMTKIFSPQTGLVFKPSLPLEVQARQRLNDLKTMAEARKSAKVVFFSPSQEASEIAFLEKGIAHMELKKICEQTQTHDTEMMTKEREEEISRKVSQRLMKRQNDLRPASTEIPIGQGKLFLGDTNSRKALDTTLHVIISCTSEVQDNREALADSEKTKTTESAPLEQFATSTAALPTHIPLSYSEERMNSTDLNDTQLFDAFQKIDDAINRGQSIFIESNDGDDRSTMVIVQYLALRGDVTFEQAWNYVAHYRPSIKAYSAQYQFLLERLSQPTPTTIEPYETFTSTASKHFTAMKAKVKEANAEELVTSAA